MVVREHPYEETEQPDGSFARTFADATEEELTWHRDREDREVEALHETDWKVQLDNELPVSLQPGETLCIPAGVYHRLIIGSGPLSVRIRKGLKQREGA